jgi:hypothetical protein
MSNMLKCSDSECGWFGNRSDADVEFDTDLTWPTSIDPDGSAEFGISVTATFSCPECGEDLDAEDMSGETVFTVELGS